MTDFERRLRRGDPVVGHWLSIADPTVAELCGRDADFVVADTEHAPSGLESLTDAVRAVEVAGSAATIARVAANDPVRIKRVLDTGVSGVVVPMVDSGDEARQAVEAVHYPPEGVRGIAASRANDYGRELDDAVAGDDPLTVVQVESEQAVDDAGAIAAVEGVDALLVGPADLSASLDAFGEYDDDRFADAVRAVLGAAGRADTPVGTLATDRDQIRRWADYGFDFQIVGTDMGYLAGGAERARRTYEGAME